jgi:predicted dinucleotide-binding enzyme
VKQPTIAILGTGEVGIALAKGFVGRGDRVIFGSRNLAGDKTRAALAAVPGATAANHVEAARSADMAVVALPWSAIPGTLTPGLANALAGKVVIDASNPLDFSAGQPALAIGHTHSGGETVQGLLPDARVVKAFNIITAGHMIHPAFPDGQPDMFIAGNDPAAKDAVAMLLRGFGWRSAIDMGDITASRLLEALAMIWITYGFRNNHWTHGFSLLNQKA